MKPRLLKIKGLNSFIDQQTIDFQSLMEHGLFGIFGPTGSGKSTILDAIILALYGEIPRCPGRKLAGIINTEVDSLYVYFEFESGPESRKRIYSVERIVKKTKNGGISTDTAFVSDITMESNRKILGDKVMTTNQVLQDIIGLNAGDFMKSVVLPQGSFSEFLQLDGKPRRGMLERIFGLEEYGDKLWNKTRSYYGRKNEEMQRLEGHLSSYGNIDKEKLDKLNNEKKQLEKDVRDGEEEYNKAQKKLELYKDIWNLQLETDKLTKEYEDKMTQKEVYLSKEESLDRAKKAYNLKPFIQKLQDLENNLIKTEESKLSLDKECEKISRIINELEAKWKLAAEQKENVLPDLMIARENLKRGVKLFEEGQSLESDRKELKSLIEDIGKDLDESTKNEEEMQRDLNNLSRELSKLKAEEVKYIITPIYRQNIEKGYDIEKEYKRLLDEVKDLYENKQSYQDKIDQKQKDYSKIEEKCRERQLIIEGLINQKKELERIRPGDSNDLLDRQKYLNKMERELEDAEQIAGDIVKINEKILELKGKRDGYKGEIEKLKLEYQNQKDEFERIEEEIAHGETQNLAAILGRDIQDGKPCPVCGSIDHPNPVRFQEQIQNIEILKGQRSTARDNLSNLQEQIATKKAQIESLDGMIVEENARLIKINDDNVVVDIDKKRGELTRLKKEFKQFQSDLEGWDKDIKGCNKEIEVSNNLLSDLRQEETKLKTTLQNNSDILKETEKLYKESNSKLEEALKAYSEIQSETDVKDFHDIIKGIRESDRRLEGLQQVILDKTGEIEGKKKAIEKIKGDINDKNLEYATLKTKILNIESNIAQKKEEINQLSGGEDPKKKLEEIKSQIQDINEQWEKVNDDWKKQNKNKDDIYKKYNSIKETYILLESQCREETAALNGMLSKNGFIDKETALEYLLPKDKMESLELDIKEYYSKIDALENRMQDIQDRLKGNSIAKEEWSFIQSEEKRLKDELEIRRKELMKLGMSIDNMADKLASKLKLLSQKRKLKKQLVHINQLMSLIKAKKFVDFVAKSQLQHIARGASIRLKDISRGRYALELDGEGNFIIRDDFNGGARRPTHTLSGGETFVTSLSLALALSTRIQMGKASLDFFFLDEGFGTLDAELLDVVISSLEQLRSDSMCVGLISHVEELKARLPKKLIVSPAISGERGTLVTMD